MNRPVCSSVASTSQDATAAAGGGLAGSALRSPVALVLFAAVAGGLLAADLLLKAWAFEHVAGRPVVLTDEVVTDQDRFWRQYPHQSIPVIPHLLDLRLTTNTGAVFGLGKGGRVFFILISVVASGVIGVMFACSRRDDRFYHLALAMILAGALGNLYDRVVFGAVRDMLHLLPGTRLWPWIFNLADAALMVGVGIVLLLAWFRPQRPPAPTPPGPVI